MPLPLAGRARVAMGLPLSVGFGLLCLYLLTFPGSISPHSSDGRAMYLVTQSLVDRRDIAIQPSMPSEVAVAPGWRTIPIPRTSCPTEPAVIGIGQSAGGPFYSKYGIGQSVAAIPLYVAGLAVAHLVPAAVRNEAATFVTSAYTSVITALTSALLCALALRLGWTRMVALSLAVLYGVSTPAWAYTTSFFSEPTVALFLLGALAAVMWDVDVGSPVAALLAGCCLGGAILTHAADTAFYVPLFILYVAVQSNPHRRIGLIVAVAAPALVALGVCAWYDVARFGSPLTTGYGIVGDVHDLHPAHTLQAFWEGVYGPLLSPGKGLVLYAPVLLLLPWALTRFWRSAAPAAWLIAGVLAVAVLAHANTLIVWLGGWAWGPRFMIPVLPILVLPLGALLDGCRVAVRRLFWIVGALGTLVQVPAVILDKNAYIAFLATNRCIWDAENLYKWHPAYSPLIGQWERVLDRSTYSVHSLADRGPTAFNIATGIFVPAPRPWWSLLSDQGARHPVLVVVIAILAAGTALAASAALRLARPARD